jgi:hypothetical protein
MASAASRERFVVCLHNEGYPASLEQRKIYRVLPDPQARRNGQVRVVDESGEDYLYPAEFFMTIELSAQVRRALRKAA